MSDCEGCAGAGRRDFLRHAAALLAALAGSPGQAAAMSVAWGRAHAREGSELAYPLPAADGALIDQEQEVILVRWQGSIHAFNLSCPHQSTALRWHPNEHQFRCPRHKSEYQPDGTFIRGRATRSMDRFAIRRRGDEVLVDVDTLFRDDRDHAGWVAAVVTA